MKMEIVITGQGRGNGKTARENAISALASRLSTDDELAARIYLEIENLAAANGLPIGNIVIGITKLADVKGIRGQAAEVFIEALRTGVNQTAAPNLDRLAQLADLTRTFTDPNNREFRRQGLLPRKEPWKKDYNDVRRGRR